jgi:SMC interacting uncharacterized protein involved in chromosome segregation
MTDTGSSELDRLLDQLRSERDELRVRLHLAKAEAKDEFEKLEHKWDRLRGRLDAVGREAKDAGQDVLTAARLLGRELKEGYARVRELI